MDSTCHYYLLTEGAGAVLFLKELEGTYLNGLDASAEEGVHHTYLEGQG